MLVNEHSLVKPADSTGCVPTIVVTPFIDIQSILSYKKEHPAGYSFLMYEIVLDYFIATGINDFTAFLYANTPLSLNSTVVAFPKMS